MWLLSFFDLIWIAPHRSSHSPIIICYYYSPDSTIWLILFSTSLTPAVTGIRNIFFFCIVFYFCIATFRVWLCNHHHAPVEINGRSVFYSWLLQMALFLRVQTKESVRERERRQARRGEERLSDAGWHGNLARWKGAWEKGEREGGGVLLSQGSSLSAASLSPTIPCRLKRIITALWVAVEEQGSPHLHIKDTLCSAVNIHNAIHCFLFRMLMPSFSLPWQHVTAYWFLLETST